LNENESRGAASAKFSKKQNKIKAGERERERFYKCVYVIKEKQRTDKRKVLRIPMRAR
jgi:hypothetical protein